MLVTQRSMDLAHGDLAHGGGDFEQSGVLRPPAVVLIPALAMSFYVWLVLVTTIPYPGKIGLDYNTLGTDWMVFYGAIRAVLSGNAPLIFDGDRFTDFLNTSFAGWLSTPLEFRPCAKFALSRCALIQAT